MRKSWRQRFKSAFFGTVLGLVIPTLAFGQATLLPNAKQQYVDDAGNPVASGHIDYFVPNTTTRKTIWQDAAKTTPAPNPLQLDAAGRPIPTGQTYGDGLYRQKVVDQNNLTVWDAVTTSTGGSGGGGVSTVGDGNFVGTILPWNGITAPTNYVFANGQQISRTVYSQYYSTSTIVLSVICTSGTNVLSGIADTQNIRVGAPVEATCVPPNATVTAVSSSSVTVSLPASVSTAVTATFFPNGNGDGSITFNVPDLRNLVIAGRGNMGGGTARGLLTSQFFGTQGPNALGSTGGQESIQIATTNLPPYTPSGTVTNGAITTTTPQQGGTAGTTTAATGQGIVVNPTTVVITSTQATSTFTGTPQGGVQTALTNVTPTFIANYVIKVLPDASTAVATGVASLGGMTGAITCGSGVVCGSQTISTVPGLLPPANVAVYASQYGVLCNGVHDDFPGTRDALVAAQTLGAVSVIMPSGTCPMISGTPNVNTFVGPGILTKPGLNIVGQGREVTYIDNQQANGYGLAVNQAWETAFRALNSLVPGTTSGNLATNTYYVQITMNDNLGNEVEVTLPKSVAVTGPTGRITITLPATTPGYTFNLYCSGSPTTQPANYCSISGSDATALGGGQTIPITAIGTAHAVPTNKIASFQQAQISNLTVTSTTNAAGANGILLFKSGYSSLINVEAKTLNGSGVVMPNYIGDLDGSFVTSVRGSKFDSVKTWCLDLAGLTLEQSNFTLDSSVLNICGTATPSIGTSVTISAITNSTTPVVTTSTPNTFVENDQIDIPNVTGMSLPADFYRVGTVTDSTHFQLKTQDGVFVNTTSLGAFASGTVSLNWRPPSVTTGTGGVRYMGLISSWTNNGYTQNFGTNIYFTEAGTSDGITMSSSDYENTVGVGVYMASAVGAMINTSECLSQIAFGTTVACYQFGTGFAAGGVSDTDLFPMKIRSDATPSTAFELFQNTGNGTTFTNTVRVHNVMNWAAFDATTRQKRFVGLTFNPVPGQARFSISALNTFKLVPTGYGCMIPLHLKATGEWTPYCVPDAGVTAVLAAGAATTSYNVYAFNSAATTAPYALSFTYDTVAPVVNQGYLVQSTDSTRTFVGTWTTDGSGNFQSAGSGTSWYPPTGTIGGTAGGDLAGTYPNPTLAAIGSATGPLGSATVSNIVTIDTKGRVTALGSATITPAVGNITGLGTGVATALGVNIGTAGSFVVNGGALGSPSSAGTLPAHTLGGTVSGGGNQINNVIIGSTTPLAGSFTTVTSSTYISATAMLWQTNGGTFAGGINTSQQWLMSGSNNTPPTGPITTISKNTAATVALGTPSGISGTAQAVLTVVGVDGSPADINVQAFGNANTPAALRLFHAAGTAGAPTATQTATTMGNNVFYGFKTASGSAYVAGGGILATSTDNWINTATGMRLDFLATATGTTGFATSASIGAGVMIGTTTDPGAGSLQLNAQQFMPNITTTSAAQTGTVCWTTGTGKLTADTTVGCLTSLLTAKNVTERLSSKKALDIVDRLDPFAFRYKKGWGDGGRYEQFGLGAEEVALIDERLVGRDPEGALQGVRYQELGAVLVGAIKELKAEVRQMRGSGMRGSR